MELFNFIVKGDEGNNINMKVRQLIEFLVFPKSFSVLSFYSKGHYAIRIRLTAEDPHDNSIIKAYPILLVGRQARKEQNKRAIINTTEFCYETEHFYVTFSQEKIILNSGCIFRIEYQENKEYKTYIDFELIHTSFKKKEFDGGEEVKKVSVVDSRRLFVNSYSSLNTFKRVLFDDSDYFSLTDVFLMAQHMGQKIRIHPFQLTQFSKMGIGERQMAHHRAFQEEMKRTQPRGIQLMNIFGTVRADEFYVKMIGEKLMRHRKLCQIYQKFRFHMSSLSSVSLSEGPALNQLEWIRLRDFKSELQLMEEYQTQSLPELFEHIYEESHMIIRNTKYIWQQFTSLLMTINFTIMEGLASFDIQAQIKTKSLWLLTYSNITALEREQRRQHFLKKREEILKILNVYEDMDLYHPFLMIQNFQAEQMPRTSSEIDSLVVLVHGYQGSSIDLEKARNFMNIYNPNCYGLLIKTVQDDIDEPIEKLGEMVAQEVRLHLINTINQYKRISFIGYSLGGILVREALKHLGKYKQKMHIYISFASPHAGICDTSNPLVKTGIWFLTNFQKNKNLKQLNCEQDQGHSITLETLSRSQQISWFKKFVAVSSREDDFVPYQSSRLEEQMLRDITKHICVSLKKRIKRLQRVEVWFDMQHYVGTLDRMTGRRAHIQFLQNRVFLDCFFSIYGPLL